MENKLNNTTFWQTVKSQMEINPSLDNEEKAIDYVCTQFSALINKPEIGGLFPIHIMISKSNFQRTQRLLDAGANLEIKVKADKDAPALLSTRLAQRFNGLNAIEIALYYKNNVTGSKKKIAQNIYDLIIASHEKTNIEKNLNQATINNITIAKVKI